MKVYAILPAGGSGERFGLSLPKQFQPVLGRPLISYTLRSFEKIDWITKIIVVVAEEHVSTLERIKKQYHHSTKVEVVLGGATRHRSIKSGMNYVCSDVVPPDVVIIHDAVRPFTKEQDLAAVVHAAAEYGASGVVRPLVSTVVAIDQDGFLKTSLDRSAYRASEMPQAFQYDAVRKAYDKCNDFDLDYGTECLQLVSKYSQARVKLIEGGENLWKVTYRRDIYAMEGLLKEEGANWAFIQSFPPSEWFGHVAATVQTVPKTVDCHQCQVSVFDSVSDATTKSSDFCTFIFCYYRLDQALVLQNTAMCFEYFGAQLAKGGMAAGGSVLHCLVHSGDPLGNDMHFLHTSFITMLLSCVSELKSPTSFHTYGVIVSEAMAITEVANMVCAVMHSREPSLSGQVYCSYGTLGGAWTVNKGSCDDMLL